MEIDIITSNINCDDSKHYIKAIYRYNEKNNLNYIFKETNKFHNDRPTIIIRPQEDYLKFSHIYPIFDLEGYSTYFNHGFYIPPVVKAICEYIGLDNIGYDHSYYISGSGIGMYLAHYMKKLGSDITLLTRKKMNCYNEILDKYSLLSIHSKLINCTRSPIDNDTVLVDLPKNPREISISTIKHLYHNINLCHKKLIEEGVVL